MIRQLMLVACFVLYALAAGPPDIFVGPSAIGTGNCSSFANRCTLNSGLAAYVNNTSATIHAANGTYPSGISISKNGASQTARLTVQCDNGVANAYAAQGACIVTGTASGFAITGNNVDLYGFDIGGNDNMNVCVSTVTGSGTTSATGNSPHLVGNYCHDLGKNVTGSNGLGCPEAGALNLSSGSAPGTDVQVLRNLVVRYGDQSKVGNPNNGCNTAQLISGHGNPFIVQNNIVGSGPVGGIVLHDACRSVVANNTIFSVKDEIILSHIDNSCLSLGGYGDNTIVNNYGFNIFGATSKIFNVSGQTHCSAAHPNLYSGNMSDGTSPPDFASPAPFSCETVNPNPWTHQVAGSFLVNPLTNGSGDYHLKVASLGIRGGLSACGSISPCIPPTDFSGTVRPVSGAQDVGAWAFTTTGVPIVNLSPSPLAFGTVPVSTTVTLPATLKNTGTTNLAFTAATIPGGGSVFRIVSTTCASPLPAGNQCTYNISATPNVAGNLTANLTLTDNAAGSPHQLPLTVTGGSAALTLTPPALAFPVTAPGACSTALTSTLTNSGSSGLIISDKVFIGTDAAMFAFGGTGTCGGTPLTLAAGASCIQSVKFCPTAPGARLASLSFPNNSPVTPVNLPLTGSGGTSTATLTPTSFGYGSVQVGTSVSHSFLYTNTGTLPLTSVTVSITGATTSYSQTNNCPASVAVGGFCAIVVVFKPGATGLLNAILAVASSAVPTPTTSGLSGTGTAPSIVLSSSAVNFGQVLLGATGNSSITATNNGTAAASISGVLTVLPFSQTNDCPAILAVNAFCTITLHATPTVLGLVTGTVAVSDNAPGNPHIANLSVTGIAPTGSLTPLSHDFGSQPNGSQGSPFSFVWANTGTGPMTWTASITGTNSGDFILGPNSCPNPLPAGQNCLIPVSFKPTGVGARGPAALSLANSSSVTPITSTLTGTGTSVASAICLSVSSVNFGNQPVNSTSIARPIVATNCGTAALTSVVVTPTGNFTQTNDFSVSVAVGGHFTIQGKFAPLAAGPLTGNFSIASNSPNTPDVVALSGFGTQSGATVTPTTIPFGHITVGNQSQVQVTVLNTSNITLPVSQPTITGTGASQFITGSCPPTLAPGANCKYFVVFQPLGALAFTATLNQPFGNGVATATVPLSGTGDAPVPTLTLNPTSLDFGNVQQGSPSSSKTVQLTNTSTTTLNLLSLLPGGSSPADVAVTSHCGATPIAIPAGNICTFDVVVTPSTVGDETASVIVTTDAASSPNTVTIAVKGTAIPVPRVQLSASSLAFSPPSITVGQTSAAQTTTVNNIGNANLLVTNVALSGPNQADFLIAPSCGTVTPGANCPIQVNCKPTVAGSLTASLDITDNASDSPQHVALTCTSIAGTPIIQVPISSIDFHNWTVGTTSGPAAFVLTNTGTANATGLAITAVGDFAVTGNCGSSLAQGVSCTESVTFSPQILCGQTDPNDPATCLSNVHLGQIQIVSNTSNSPQTIALQGTAIPVPPPPGPITITMGGILKLGGHFVVGVQ